MNILFYDLNGSFLAYDIEYWLKALGHKCTKRFHKVMDKYYDEVFEGEFQKVLGNQNFDCVLTTNYYPVVARVCYKKSIKYYSWTYDSPPELPSTETMEYPTNRMFFFSKYDAWLYKEKHGFENVDYLPLAVNTDRLDKVAKFKKNFACDVSLVGGLYKSSFMAFREIMTEEQKQYVDASVLVQLKHSGSVVIDAILTDEFVKGVCDYYKKQSECAVQPSKEALFYSICAHITHIDRVSLLRMSAERGYDTKLFYGGIKPEDRELLKKDNITLRENVNYMEEMPQVFSSSKVNLNPTLRANRTGIPLRIVDVLGCGGFLLTNHQPELDDFFNDDEIVTYENHEEAIEKIDYFLKHDDERKEIARNGYERVKTDFNYTDRLTRMFSV